MIITYEIEIDFGDEITDGEPTPTEADVANALSDGLSERGLNFVDISATRQ